MEIQYTTKIDYLSEAADLFTRQRCPMPNDPAHNMLAVCERYEKLVRQYRIPPETAEEHRRRYLRPLARAIDDALLKPPALSPEEMAFFFEPRFHSYFSAAGFLFVGKNYAESLGRPFDELNETEWEETCFTMLDWASPSGLSAPFSLQELAEQIEQIFSEDSQRWMVFRLITGAKAYLHRLEEALMPAAEALRSHQDALAPLVEESLAFVQKGVQEKGPLFFREAFHIEPAADAPVHLRFSLIRNGEFSSFHSPHRQELQMGVLEKVLAGLHFQQMSPERLLELFKALGDKRRMEILFLLREHPYYGQELAEKLSLSPATISHHMNLMLQCGLIVMEQDGLKMRYSISPDTAKQFLSALEEALL